MSIYTEAIKFYYSARTRYRVHSPFFFEIVSEILENKHYYAFDEIEYQRQQLLKSKKSMTMIDLGAGSRKNNQQKKKISEVAATSLSSPWQCQILFKLIHLLKPETIIEIGSSLGVSTAYISKAHSKAEVYSLEGNDDSITIAKNLNRALGISKVNFIKGNFNDTLPTLLNKLPTVDLVFADGNHQKAATLNYYHLIKEKRNPKTVIVFDDIYWSSEMTEAWEEIKKDPEVKGSLDFFYFGIVFFNPDLKEQKHLKILEKKYKPWQKFI